MSTIDTIFESFRHPKLSHNKYAPIEVVPLWKRIWQWYCRAEALRRSRAQLLQLTDRELKDIGITRAQAEEEANKPNFLIDHQ